MSTDNSLEVITLPKKVEESLKNKDKSSMIRDVNYHNPNVMTYHFRTKLTNGYVGNSSQFILEEDIYKFCTLSECIFDSFELNTLNSINGIVNLEVGKYSLTIERAVAYSWEEIEAELRKFLNLTGLASTENI